MVLLAGTVTGDSSIDAYESYTVDYSTTTTDGIADWNVDWGDGATAWFQTQSLSGSQSHEYTTGPAERTITVSLLDDDGSWGSHTLGVEVGEASTRWRRGRTRWA
jgi:hypothetical protein